MVSGTIGSEDPKGQRANANFEKDWGKGGFEMA